MEDRHSDRQGQQHESQHRFRDDPGRDGQALDHQRNRDGHVQDMPTEASNMKLAA